METNTFKSNCLINAIIHFIIYFPYGKIKWDHNSPSGGVSYFCEVKGKKFRFRRKIRRYGNKSKYLFEGYVYEERI